MQIQKSYNWPTQCLLIITSLAFNYWHQVESKRVTPVNIIQKYNSPTQNISEFHSSVGELEESIMSWIGTRIQHHQIPIKSQSPRRRKTKSGLLIESNITEEQNAISTSSSSSRPTQKFTERTPNEPLQRLRNSINANALRVLHGQESMDTGSHISGLFPQLLNVATRASITVNATCGQNGVEEYCKLVDAYPHRNWTKQCSICNTQSSDRAKQRSIESLISSYDYTWWQSPTLQAGQQFEYVTIILDLKQAYQVYFIMLKSANSPRPASWILEKSLDGNFYKPWQYFGLSNADCIRRYNLSGQNGKYVFRNDSEVICSTQFSKTLPLENGELHVSLLKNRPGAMTQSEEVMQFITARYIRIRLQGMHSTANLENSVNWLLDAVSLKKRSFYSLKQIRVSARLNCHGHANRTQEVMGNSVQCICQHNTCGPQCDVCCPMFQNRAFSIGHACEICQCHGHAFSCTYDTFLNRGICQNCTNNTTGNECEFCLIGYYRTLGAPSTEPCQPCSCNPQRSTGKCDPLGGACHCLKGFKGTNCEECDVNHYGENCQRCDCDTRGTLVGTACTGKCHCKDNVKGETCTECALGFYNLNVINPEGCSRCWCSHVSKNCQSAKLQNLSFETLHGWTLTNLQRTQTISVTLGTDQKRLVFGNDLDEVEAIYWMAPVGYLGNHLTSYGASLRLQLAWAVMRGDTSGKPTTGPNVIFCGKNGLKIAYADESFESLQVTLNVTLTEIGWYHVPPVAKNIISHLRRTKDEFYHGEAVTRPQFLSVLASLDAVLIRASFHTDQVETALERAIMYSGGLELGDQATTQVEECICPHGYTGLSCESCAFGYKRIYENSSDHQLLEKCIPCPCSGHSNSCDLESGNCGACMHNTFGDRCERCQLGYYGNPLQGTPHDCKRCGCPLIQESNNFSPSCQLRSFTYMNINSQLELIERSEYICTQCPEGYTGDHCQMCDDGYYGNPLQIGSNCQRCNCHEGPCNVTTGTCITCHGNTEGWHCERCKLGYWGDPAIGCESCNCHEEGSESGQCDSTDGQCLCRPRFGGHKCNECVPGYSNVELSCIPCNCDAFGATVQGKCNFRTGQCECKVGVMGIKCQECQDGYFGMNMSFEQLEDVAKLRLTENDQNWESIVNTEDYIDQFDAVACEECQCSHDGSSSLACDKRSGQCSCLLNVEGRRCDKCKAGYWNLTRGLGCMDCKCDLSGALTHECNQWTGQCNCKIGVGGRKCMECNEGFYGFSTNGCQQCAACRLEGQVCDPYNGRCVCPKNTRGLGCVQCVPGTWGWQAFIGCRECACDHIGSIGQHCATVDGQCQCREGYGGFTCNTCAVGYFGYPECRRCGCDSAGSFSRGDSSIACDSNGQCPCKALVVGLKCDTCMQSTFGLSGLNPEGCTRCFCFERATECQQSELSWGHIRVVEARYLSVQQIYSQNVTSGEFKYIVVAQMAGSVSYRDAEIHHTNDLSLLPSSTGNVSIATYSPFYQPLFFQLPPQFNGDRTTSYGGYLNYSVITKGAHSPLDRKVLAQYPLVQLHAHTKLVLDFYEYEEFEYSLNVTHRVQLQESYWKYHHNSQPVDRATLMTALQNVRHIYLRAFAFAEFQQVILHNVRMDAAIYVQGSTNLIARGVEHCKCPKRFDGFSCQDPGRSFYRWRNSSESDNVIIEDLIGRVAPCHCNGRSNECDRETGQCMSCRGNSGGSHCQQCADGYFGDPNSDLGCQACPCPETNRNFAHGCNVREDEVHCVCKLGYTGRLCEYCRLDFFGNPMMNPNSSCQACNCNNNGISKLGCDAVSGQCHCREGVFGLKCNKCKAKNHHLMDEGCQLCDNCTLLVLGYVELVNHELHRHLHNVDLKDIPAPYLKLSELELAYNIWCALQLNYKEAKYLILNYDTPGLLKLIAHAEQKKFQLRKVLVTIGKRLYALNSMQEEAFLLQHDMRMLYAEIMNTLYNLQNYGQGDRHLSLPIALEQARFHLQAIQQHHHVIQDIRRTNDCAWQNLYQFGNATDAAFDQRVRLEMLWRDINQSNHRLADMRLHIDRIQDVKSEANDTLEHVQNLSGHLKEQHQQLIDLGYRIEHSIYQNYLERGQQNLSKSNQQQTQLIDRRYKLSAVVVLLNESIKAQAEMQREVLKHWLPKAEKNAARIFERSNEYKSHFQLIKNGARIALLASSAHNNISKAIERVRQDLLLSQQQVHKAHRTLNPSYGRFIIDQAKDLFHRSKQFQREALQQMQLTMTLKGKLQEQHVDIEKIKRTIFETGSRCNNITSQLQLLTINMPHLQVQKCMDLAENISSNMHAALLNSRNMQQLIKNMRNYFDMLEPDWEIKLGMAEENISLTKTNLRLTNVSVNYMEQQAAREEKDFRFWNNSMIQKLQHLKDLIAKARHAAEAIDVSLESLGPKCTRTYLPISYGLSTSNSLRLNFALSNYMGNSPLLLVQGIARRHISLDLYKRKVRLIWNLGGRSGTITYPLEVQTRDPKFDDAWYQVEANRTLNHGSLLVRRMNNFGVLAPAETVTGSSDAENTRFYQSYDERIILGGSASKEFTKGLNVVVHQVEVDNKPLGLWNFVNSEGRCGGAMIGARESSASSVARHFNGFGYAQLKMTRPRPYRKNLFALQMTFKSLDENALLFLAVDDKNNRSVSITLSRGRIMFRIVYGVESKLEINTTKRYNTGHWIKFEAAREFSVRRGTETGVLRVNSDHAISGAPTVPVKINILPDLSKAMYYIGGVPPGFTSGSTKAPGAGNRFLGCMKDVQINGETYDPLQSSSYFGVEASCKDMITRAGFSGNGYLELPSQSLMKHANTGLVFRTLQSECLLLLAAYPAEVLVDYDVKDIKGNYSISLVNGQLQVWINSGRSIIKMCSNTSQLNDGEFHVVNLIKAGRKVKLMVDDKLHDVQSLSGSPSVVNLPQDTGGLYIGGAPLDNRFTTLAPTFAKLKGAVQDVVFNNRTIYFNNAMTFLNVQIGRSGPLMGSFMGDPKNFVFKTEPMLGKSFTASPEGCKRIGSYSYEPHAFKFGDELFSFSQLRLAERHFWQRNFLWSFDFRTFHPNGMLFLSPGSKEKPKHYVALLLKDGQLVLIVRGRRREDLQLTAKLNDGEWHRVSVSRYERKITMSVKIGRTDQKTSAQINISKKICASQLVLVGGLPHAPLKLPSELYVRLETFKGCLRNVIINNSTQDLARPGKHANVGQCFPTVERGSYFSGDAYAIFKRNFHVSNYFEIYIEFRTSELSGVLLSVSEPSGFPALSLEVNNGNIVFSCDLGNGVPLRVNSTLPSKYAICDNNWHNITALFDGGHIALRVDKFPTTVGLSNQRNVGKVQTRSPLFIGGLAEIAPSGCLLTRDNFKGCIRNVSIRNEKRNWTDMDDLHNVLLSECLMSSEDS